MNNTIQLEISEYGRLVIYVARLCERDGPGNSCLFTTSEGAIKWALWKATVSSKGSCLYTNIHESGEGLVPLFRATWDGGSATVERRVEYINNTKQFTDEVELMYNLIVKDKKKE